ncbi:MBL fold metallo-hydrolase [Bacillus sp. REN10]|uniref:MBL fold metallo-hydrolase n=1 Tax=Bacillus sp. REN10 TaxID=2782541 RepID=UPI00193C543C|nr:MBL fold metallo-hydrolase [Bacillus sp. REN10]
MTNVERFGDIAKITLPTPFSVGDVNVYVIKGDRLTLVDAGVKTKASWEAFVYGLSQLGYTPEDIEQVVLTHHHPDHVGLIDFLSDEVDVIGHPYCAKWLSWDEEFMKEYIDFLRALYVQLGLPKEMEFRPEQIGAPLKFSCEQAKLTQEVQEGERLLGLDEWLVYETPGHSQSHVVFFREKDGVLLAGDHLLATISSNPLLEPPLIVGEERPKPQVQYNHSLRKMLQLPIEIAYTGHGAEVKNSHALIHHRLKRQHERAISVKGMLKDRAMTAFQVCQQLFPSIYQKETALTLSETVGQLDYLQDNGQVEARLNDEGVLYYFSV